VIIGGGPTGLTVANDLAPHAAKGSVEITILTRSDHLDICLGQPRALVNPAFAQEALPTLDSVLQGSKKPRVVTVADITAVGGGGVSYTTPKGGSETVQADAIVIATGSRYRGKYIKNNDGLPKQEWTKRMAEWRAAAAKSKHVVVIGAGVTGIEVAGELATEHPQGKVTIVHGGKYLGEVDEKFHKKVVSCFESLKGKVDIITEDRLDAEEALSFPEGAKTLKTRSGKAIEAVDMVVHCSGVTPNAGFLDKTHLDERGYIKVDDTLQVPTLTNPTCLVFAAGDVTACGWGRLILSEKMAKACVKNILKIVAGQPVQKVFDATSGKKPFLPAMTSIGRTQGVASVPFTNKWLGRSVKAPSLLVGMVMPNFQKGFKMSKEAMGPSPL